MGTAVWEDPVQFQRIEVKAATTLASGESLVIYRRDNSVVSPQKHGGEITEKQPIRREIIRGPCLYMPQVASEWIHNFSWHGSDRSSPDILRKRPDGLKFTKLLTTPAQTYFDIENVRTNDDALLVIRLMIFYSITDVVLMLDSTKDPIADIINSVSSDVIEFASGLSFEKFKERADTLNNLPVYKNLTTRAEQMGLTVAKVVFRGFIAPPRLQKMHDDAIEKRTRLVLESESELQEQQMKDDRLERDEARNRRKHQMETTEAEHRASLQRRRFEAEQLEARQRKEQEIDLAKQKQEQEIMLAQRKQEQELALLDRMKKALDLNPQAIASIVVSREQGAPAKLVQITGSADIKPTLELGA